MPKTRPAKSSQRRKGQELYAARLRAVAPLVTFTLPKRAPGSYDKRKLKKYYEYLFGTDARRKKDKSVSVRQGIAQGLRIKVTRKDPKRLAKIQRDLGQGELAGIKYAFVPTILDPENGRPVRVKIKEYAPDSGRSTLITTVGVGMIFGMFDRKALLKDPEAETERLMDELEDQLPPGMTIRYKLLCDDKMTFQNYRREQVYGSPGGVAFSMTSYSKTWEKWLNGLVCEFAPDNKLIKSYERTKESQGEIRTKIFKIRGEWVNALDTLQMLKGNAPIEPIARGATGAVDDPTIRVVMQELRKAGHVSGDDNRWSLLPSGRAYLAHGRGTLPIFNRKK